MKLLSIASDSKTVKGEKFGVMTAILYLAPSDTSRVMDVCPFSSKGCRDACLNTAGRASIFPAILEARVRKTRWFHSDREAFIAQLIKEIQSFVKSANRKGMKACVRLNGTSELYVLAKRIAPLFPDLQFYDYVKGPQPWLRTMPNYHLTFSHSESNWSDCVDALAHNVNVAVVFDTKRGQPLPATFRGYDVIDGDISDLRWADERTGVIVGLRAKGRAKKDTCGFVIRETAQPLVQIGTLANVTA